MESVSSRIPARGVFSSWLASDTKRRRGQLSDLVVSPNHGPVAVSSLPDLADGLEQVPDLPGEGTGQQGAEGYH